MTFTTTSILNKNTYIKVMYIGLYKKLSFIIMSIFGTLLLTTTLLNSLNIINFTTYGTWYDLSIGLFLISAPTIIVLMSLKQLNSNPSLLKEVIYIFNDDGFTVQGETFKTELSWSHIIKYKEIGKYLLLYHTSKFGNYVDRTNLSTEQVQFIKTKIVKK